MTHIDIVFAKSADPNPDFRFVEVEDASGASVEVGTWVERPDKYWALRIPASQWQPTDTIPRDGRLVLLWVSAVRYGEDDDGRRFEQDCSVVDFGAWVASFDGGDGYADAYGAPHGDAQHVTHWMPLPEPPKEPPCSP